MIILVSTSLVETFDRTITYNIGHFFSKVLHTLYRVEKNEG